MRIMQFILRYRQMQFEWCENEWVRGGCYHWPSPTMDAFAAIGTTTYGRHPQVWMQVPSWVDCAAGPVFRLRLIFRLRRNGNMRSAPTRPADRTQTLRTSPVSDDTTATGQATTRRAMWIPTSEAPCMSARIRPIRGGFTTCSAMCLSCASTAISRRRAALSPMWSRSIRGGRGMMRRHPATVALRVADAGISEIPSGFTIGGAILVPIRTISVSVRL